MIDLQEKYVRIVYDILGQHVPHADIYVFGSRAAGKVKTHYDLDLAVVDSLNIPPEVLFALQEDLADSDLPFRVDAVDYHAVSESFQRQISSQWQLLRQETRN